MVSVFYYIKTRDQNNLDFNEKIITESKLKDQKIVDLNKQLELKDRDLSRALKESQTKDNNINDLNKQIGLKVKQLDEVIKDSDLKNKKITELDQNLVKLQNEMKVIDNCLQKDKQIESLGQELKQKAEEVDKQIKKVFKTKLFSQIN